MAEHRQMERLIDEYVDGALDDLRARAVRGHLRACTDCSAKVDATRRILAAAEELPALEPPTSMWDAIAAGLDDDDAHLAGRGRLFWLWQSLGRRLAFGGGALAVAGLIVWFAALRGRTALAPALETVRIAPSPESLYDEALREVERADADYQAAIADLRALAKTERLRWEPGVQRVFDENLTVIDAAVARQAELARKSPGDVAVADALAEGYRKEIDFLQSAVVRGETQ